MGGRSACLLFLEIEGAEIGVWGLGCGYLGGGGWGWFKAVAGVVFGGRRGRAHLLFGGKRGGVATRFKNLVKSRQKTRNDFHYTKMA